MDSGCCTGRPCKRFAGPRYHAKSRTGLHPHGGPHSPATVAEPSSFLRLPFFHHFFDLNSAVNVQKTIVIPRREKGVAAEAERQRHAESTQRAGGDQLTRRGYERKGTIQQPLLREQIKLPGLHTMLLLTTIHHKSSRTLQPAPYWTCAVSSTYEKIRFFGVC